MNNLESLFKNFLITQGYKDFSNTGNPSTVFDYCKRINYVCEIENITWKQLTENIDLIIDLYGPQGKKHMLGAKSHNAVISSLKQFKLFTKGQNFTTNNASKNDISNSFIEHELRKNNISYNVLKNSFFEIKISNNKYILKSRTYDNKYTFVAKSEIPKLSENIIIALVEWINDKPSHLYLIPTSEWNNDKWSILKNYNYRDLASAPEWGININKNNIQELKNFQFNNIITLLKAKENKKMIEEIENLQEQENETEKQALIKVRLGHSKLREEIFKTKEECEICGLKHSKLLIASHIKPWAKSDNFEKLDAENILLLCSMHDALFDKGLISFDDSGKILISSELNETEKALVNINEESHINIISNKQKEYLAYHRNNIFIK